MQIENTTKVIHQDPDSIELGTAGKGGCIKVYGNFNNTVEFEAKIDKALQVQAKANLLRAKYLGGGEQ